MLSQLLSTDEYHSGGSVPRSRESSINYKVYLIFDVSIIFFLYLCDTRFLKLLFDKTAHFSIAEILLVNKNLQYIFIWSSSSILNFPADHDMKSHSLSFLHVWKSRFIMFLIKVLSSLQLMNITQKDLLF